MIICTNKIEINGVALEKVNRTKYSNALIDTIFLIVSPFSVQSSTKRIYDVSLSPIGTCYVYEK